MTTPNGVTLVAQLPDGSTVDVTEEVSALYDLMIGSMDWGSGFLTVEDAVPVARLARVAGFAQSEEAERYMRREQHNEEQVAFWRAHPDAARGWAPDQRPHHDHAFSSVGRCMYRWCEADAPRDL